MTKLTKIMLNGFGQPLIGEDGEGIVGTMLKHPKLKKEISQLVFGKNNMNNVSKKYQKL